MLTTKIALKFRGLLTIAGIAFVVTIVTPNQSEAQFGKLKNKLKQEAEKKITKPKEAEKPAESSDSTKADGATSRTGDSAATGGDSFQLYTKFDFVPGQKVLFFDDLSGEEVGEFPSRWNLMSGVFEVAKVGTESWIMASARGEISPKILVNKLPEKYTIEFDFLNRTSVYRGAYSIDFSWYDSTGYAAGHLNLFSNTTATFYMKQSGSGEDKISDKKLPASFASGIHTVRFMVSKSSVKAFVDNERMVNAPKTDAFMPNKFAIRIHGDDTDFEVERIFFRNFRFAEGGKTMREQLDEDGHIVTHGIYFDVNADKIRGESYRTLADIAQMLTDDATLKLKIEGHTDSDGNDASNLDLSERRAKSVRQYLIENYKIAGDRLEAKGLGESKPIDANTTPEGKANNRRVELTKL